MGGASSVAFSREELEVYEAVTNLTGAEIIVLYNKFMALGGRKGGEADAAMQAAATGALEGGGGGANGVKVPVAKVTGQEEFANNPFRTRLCQIFSSEPTQSATWGDLAWDEYLDLYSCLSPNAPLEDKMKTAFRMYDFDDNGYLTEQDLAKLLETLATPPTKDGKDNQCLLNANEVKEIVSRVMRDCDIDGNQRLSYAEFSKVLERIPVRAQPHRQHTLIQRSAPAATHHSWYGTHAVPGRRLLTTAPLCACGRSRSR